MRQQVWQLIVIIAHFLCYREEWYDRKELVMAGKVQCRRDKVTNVGAQRRFVSMKTVESEGNGNNQKECLVFGERSSELKLTTNDSQ